MDQNETKPSIVPWKKRLGIFSIVTQPISFVSFYLAYLLIFVSAIAGGGDGPGFDTNISNIIGFIAVVFFVIWFISYIIGIIYFIKNRKQRTLIWYTILVFIFLGLYPLLIAASLGLTSMSIGFNSQSKKNASSTIHETNAISIQAALEGTYAKSNKSPKIYCGENGFECGTYTFKQLMEHYSLQQSKTNIDCKNKDAEWGGIGEISEQGYRLHVYGQDCTGELDTIEVGTMQSSATEQNTIEKNYLFLATMGLDSDVVNSRKIQILLYSAIDGKKINSFSIELDDPLMPVSSATSSGSNDSVQYNHETSQVYIATFGTSPFAGNCVNLDKTCNNRIYKAGTQDKTPILIYDTEETWDNWIVNSTDNSIIISQKNENLQKIKKLNGSDGKLIWQKDFDLKDFTATRELVVSEDGVRIYQASVESVEWRDYRK
jgi:hypothetical protein